MQIESIENLVIKPTTKKVEQETVSVDIENDPSINKNLFDELMETNKIQQLSDSQLYKLLSINLENVLTKIIRNNDIRYIKAIVTPRFLNTLIRVACTKDLDFMYVKYINTIIYDYLILDDHLKDSNVENLLYSLAKIINRRYIPLLVGAGIPEKLSTFIVLSRFSSNIEETNVRRMNFVISGSSDTALFDEQTIVNIYQYLFNHVTPLFIGTMFDTVNEEEEWITDDILEISSVINLAVIDILNSLPTESITRVLKSFLEVYEYREQPEIKFSLNTLSNDYSQINQAINNLKNQGYRIP